MTRATLTRLRLVVPGVIILIVAFFLLPSSLRFQDVSQYLVSPMGLFSLVIVCVMGGLYNITGIRWLFLRDALSVIQANIKQKLTVPFYGDEQIRANIESLIRGRQLMHVFYRIVDNDESLKVKAQGVYSNGLLWSTTADVMIISSFAVPVYLIAHLFNPLPHYCVVAFILSAIYLIAALFLMPKVTAEHIELSSEQLEFIVQHYRDELYKQLLDLASGQPVESVATRDDPNAQ